MSLHHLDPEMAPTCHLCAWLQALPIHSQVLDLHICWLRLAAVYLPSTSFMTVLMFAAELHINSALPLVHSTRYAKCDTPKEICKFDTVWLRSSIVGELDFFLQRPRCFLARADAPAELLVLPRSGFERMGAQAPALATLLQARCHL